MSQKTTSAKRPLEEDSTIGSLENKRSKLPEIPLEEEFQCTICQEVIYQPTTLDCGHNFCLLCVHSISKNSYRYKCPNCRKDMSMEPIDYQKNLFMERLMNQLGGEKYQSFCQKRELEKLVDRVEKKYNSSRLYDIITNNINQELKDKISINLSDLMKNLEPMFGTKYEYAIIILIEDTYLVLGDQIIGNTVDQCVDYFKEKKDFTNDKLIYLINQIKVEDKKIAKLFKLYQFQPNNIEESNAVESKSRKLREERGSLAIYTELEELIDLYQSDAQSE